MNVMEMSAVVMDFLSPYFFLVALFLVSICFLSLSFRAKLSPVDGCHLPPGRTGWPIIGESLNFYAAIHNGCPEMFVTERPSKYSPDVFRTSLFGENIAVFCGAPGNKFLFSADNKYVKMWWPKSVSKVLFSLEAGKDKINSKVNNYIPEFLKPEPLKYFVPVMDSIAKDHLKKNWFPNGQVRVSPLAKDFAFEVTCRIFLNIKDARDIEELSSYDSLMPGLLSIPINIPGTTFNKAIEEGKKIREKLINLIRKRKDEIVKGEDDNSTDLLTRLLKETDDNEMDISYTIISFIVASYESMSTATTFVVYYLAQFPRIYDRVYKEQLEIAKSKNEVETLTWDDIQKMKYSWNVACDSIRLCPPSQGSFREAVTYFTYAGYTVPKGWKTFSTTLSTHKNPKYFPDPEKFDPARFEGSGPALFTYTPFGGGPRMCRGRGFARVELLAFMHNLVTIFRFEKVDLNEKILYNPNPFPANGLPHLNYITRMGYICMHTK